MKTYGNIILMTVICIVIFWVFMALRPANAFSETTTRGGCSTWDCRYSFNSPLSPCQRVAAQRLLDAIRARNQGQHVRLPNMRAELACR